MLAINYSQFIEEFRRELFSKGLKIHDQIIPDGNLHRFHIDGDEPSSKNGWYALHIYNNFAIGVYGSWKNSTGYNKWYSQPTQSMSAQEKQYCNEYFKSIAKQNKEKQEIKWNNAAIKAVSNWNSFNSATSEHPYLQRKQVQSHGLRNDNLNNLIVPIHDSNHMIVSYQIIAEDGNKKFLSGGQTRSCYYLIGEIKAILYIAEGYATAATIYEATGIAIAVAFNCHNILEVATVLKQQYPSIEIIIAADNDHNTSNNPGLTSAKNAAVKLGLKFVYPTFLPGSQGTDFNDLMLMSGIDVLKRQLNNNTELFEFKAITIGELIKKDFKPREMIVTPWLPTQGLAMIYAKRGIGKTFLGLEIAYAVASGNNCLGGYWKITKPRKVLYIDGEMAGITMQERIKLIANGHNKELLNNDYFMFLNQDILADEQIMPDLSTLEGQNKIEPLLQDAELIIIDNISTLCPQVKENDADSWLYMQNWLLKQRKLGRSVILIHHAGKGGQQRGTSRKEDILDCVIALKQNSDDDDCENTGFIINFEKHRHFFNNDTVPLKCKLISKNGSITWQCYPEIEDKLKKFANCIKNGMNKKSIMEELNISKSTYFNWQKDAKVQGMI